MSSHVTVFGKMYSLKTQFAKKVRQRNKSHRPATTPRHRRLVHSTYTVVLASQLVTFNSSQPQSSSVLLHANAEHTNRVTYSCTALHTYPIAATKSFPTCVAHGTFYNPPSYRSMPLPPTSYTIVGCDALLLPLLPGRFFVQRSFTRPSLKYTGYVFFFLYFHFFLFFFFFLNI